MARILLLCWRDSTHPQGGGSERYLEHVADGLAAAGHTVVYRTSRSSGAPRWEVRPAGVSAAGVSAAGATGPGVTVSRGGGRFTVYPRALGAMLLGRLGVGPLGALRKPDVVVDTQNGVPFFARLATTAPVVVLVHHIHREQWPVAGWLVARIGWWIESWLSPRVHSGSQYVTVSLPSADELADLGVDPARIAVVRNGLDPLPAGVRPGAPGARAEGPHLVVLSRLVPHKHVEDALDVLAALRRTHPGLVLDVIGSGWWSDRLREYAVDLGLDRGPDGTGPRHPAGAVVFHGHVDEATKHRILAAASLHLMPSRKEGWGLAVSEAAQHGVPTIGYHHAAGLRDSIDDGETGLLVTDVAAMRSAAERLLADAGLRDRMGEAARRKAAGLSWPATGAAMAEVLTAVTEGRRVSGVIGDPPRRAPSPPVR
ncbi:glycosyltransferase family 4 protein [Dietzia sp. 2505]|uniref:glycosyltransferase family 4 protein n=1 Tax=Dietzia sp. 2505 TaxID=3156457 RepID=UPI0033921EF2